MGRLRTWRPAPACKGFILRFCSTRPLSGFESHPTFRRLEDQIVWYDTESTRNKRWYEGIKVVELVSAASVPLAAVLGPSEWLTGGLGVLVVVLEGVQQLKQFHANWISYRS